MAADPERTLAASETGAAKREPRDAGARVVSRSLPGKFRALARSVLPRLCGLVLPMAVTSAVFPCFAQESASGGPVPLAAEPFLQESADSLTEVLEMLAARGECASSLYLPFKASSPEGTEASRSWRSKGWWATSKGRVATAVLDSAPSRPSVLYEWAVWDGARSTLGTLALDRAGFAEADLVNGALMLSAQEVRVGRKPFPGALSRAWLPTQLGWGTANQPWGKYLKSMTDLRLRGREVVRGVDCVRLTFDMGGQPGKAVFPWTLWIDDRDSFLVLRTVSYHSSQAMPETECLTLAGVDNIEIEGETWRATRCADVLAWDNVGPGLRVGTRGIVRNGIRLLAHLDADIEVDLGRIVCGDRLDERLFSVLGQADAIMQDEDASTAQDDGEHRR